MSKTATAQNKIPLDLIDETAVRQIVGGTKPISKPTMYRMIAAGRLPRGVFVTPGSRRYSRQEVEASIRALFAARDGVPS
jgi:predicted DNA-binding transcriptional regulator AlpA